MLLLQWSPVVTTDTTWTPMAKISQNLSYLVMEVKADMLAWRWYKSPTDSKLGSFAPNLEQNTKKTLFIYSKIQSYGIGFAF